MLLINSKSSRLVSLVLSAILLGSICASVDVKSVETVLRNPNNKLFNSLEKTPINYVCQHLIGQLSLCGAPEFDAFSSSIQGFPVSLSKSYTAAFCERCEYSPLSFAADADNVSPPSESDTSSPIEGTPGYTTINSVLTPCESSKYSNASTNFECVSCPVGSVAPQIGSSQCSFCPDATYTVNGLFCEPCKAGYMCQKGLAPSICPSGTYSPGSSASCLACSLDNQFSSHVGSSQCSTTSPSQAVNSDHTAAIPCPIGSSCPNGVAVPCHAGYFANVTGLTSCYNCKPGSYQSKSGQSSCITAVAPQYSSTIASTSVSTCPAGSYISDNQCILCPAGSYCSGSGDMTPITADNQYSPAGASEASTCPVGTMANKDHTDCGSCSNGYYKKDSVCTICEAGNFCVADLMYPAPAGSYQSETGQSTFKPCTEGTYSQSGATTCIACAAGQYPSSDKSTCVSCPAGYSCNVENQISVKTQCTPGHFSTGGASTCSEAQLGYYAPLSGSTQQLACSSVFEFQNLTAQASCKLVSPGYYKVSDSSAVKCSPGFMCTGNGNAIPCNSASQYQPEGGMVLCDNIPAGSYKISNTEIATCPIGSMCSSGIKTECASPNYQPSSGQSSCLKCASGSYLKTSTVCDTCIEGSMCSGNGLAAMCPESTYAPTGSSYCAVCALANQYSPKNSSSCLVASAGDMPTPTKNSTTKCAAGYSCPSGAPVGCTPGYFSVAGASACSSCTGSTYTPNSYSTTCLACPAGSYVANSASSCNQCQSGYICAGSGDMAICPAGTYSLLGETSCTSCTTEGTYSHAGSSKCYLASPGYTASSDHTEQIPCPAGSSCPAGVPEACLAGQYSSAGAISCISCNVGSYQPKTGQTECIVAKLPYYVSLPGASSQQSCAEGGYYVLDNQCVQCPAGSFCPADTGAKTDITAQNQYAPAGSSSALTCPSGFVANSDHSACTVCLPGYYMTDEKSCIICPEGYACSNSIKTACQSGYFQSQTGQTTCEACAKNTFSPEAASKCAPCDAGSYFDTILGQCKECPAGESCALSKDGSIARETCAAGTYSQAAASECTNAPPGAFVPLPGSSSFKLCSGANEFSHKAGAIKCSITIAGTYKVNNTAAAECPAGSMCSGNGLAEACSAQSSYSPSKGQSSCSPVPSGLYKVSNSFAAICNAGSYCTSGMSQPCSETSEYQPYTGKDSCKKVADGYYKVTDSKADLCPEGSYCLSGVKTACDEGYTSKVGATSCFLAFPEQQHSSKLSLWYLFIWIPLALSGVAGIFYAYKCVRSQKPKSFT